MQKNLINWLALHRTLGVGPSKFQHFLQQDPNLDQLPQVAVATMQNSKHLIKQDLAWANQPNCHILLLSDANYPQLLKNIANPPPVLFIQGNIELLNKPQLAIVGSRKASCFGKQTSFNFAAELSQLGMVITSGLAIGIDTAAHKGTLGNKVGTIAVLGSGLNIIYPKQNYDLFQQIVSGGGALVSEFPLGVQPDARHFPRRNRIISGLSFGVVVIEASINSGSLITADYALEQNREVFVVPGSIYDKNVKGCHKLIKQGAKLVENISEIVEDLGFMNSSIKGSQNTSYLNNRFSGYAGTLTAKDLADTNNSSNASGCSSISLDKLHTKVLDNILYSVTATDLIIKNSGLGASQVNSSLVNLELLGYIVSVPGGYAKLL